MKILAALLLASSVASASDLLGPIWHLQGKHIGDGEPLSWTIEYLDSWGRTVVDTNGGHFYHDRCCGSFRTDDPSWNYSQQYWGLYPMYYIGTTMRYRITLCNNSNRTYENLRVVAIQEYLTEDGSWGERLGPDAAKDWYVRELAPHSCLVFEGTCRIMGDAHGGLDQTHLQVQHWNAGSGQPGPGSVIIDDTHAAIWCPPEQEGVAQQTAGSSAGVSITAGIRGYVEPGRGQVATIDVIPSGSGQIAVRVFDRNGTLVREIKRYSGGSREVIYWDGTDGAGMAVAPGTYLMVVEGPGVQAKERIAVVR